MPAAMVMLEKFCKYFCTNFLIVSKFFKIVNSNFGDIVCSRLRQVHKEEFLKISGKSVQ